MLSPLRLRYARRVLGVGVRDLTGGFKCFRASALRAIEFGSATAQGYAFQVELTWRVLSLGLTVVEVPIRFRERRLGESKMSARIAREAAWRVPALRYGSGGGVRYRTDAHLPIHCCMKADQLAVVQGWPHTVVTLRRWTGARRGGVLGAWALGSLLVTAALLGATWLVADHRGPRPDPSQSTPASTGPATLQDFRYVLGRNLTVLALHALACVAGFMAGWVAPGERALAHAVATPVRWRSSSSPPRRSSRCSPRPTRSATSPPTSPASSASRPHTLLLAILPHAAAGAVRGLPPARRLVDRQRRGAWHELLAATIATTAVAVPLIVLAAGDRDRA